MGTKMPSDPTSPCQEKRDINISQSPATLEKRRRRSSRPSSSSRKRESTSAASSDKKKSEIGIETGTGTGTGTSSSSTRKSRSSSAHQRSRTPTSKSSSRRSPRNPARGTNVERKRASRRTSTEEGIGRPQVYEKEDESVGSSSRQSDHESMGSAAQEPEYLKTPGSNYSRSSRVISVSSGSRSSPRAPQSPADTPSSKGQRSSRLLKLTSSSHKRNMKKLASPDLQKKSEHSVSASAAVGTLSPTTGFEVTPVTGNISTWEMRQRFQREFPAEPRPSDTILRQLYKADKVAEYERMERYKQEFSGEPIPSDEVLKKLYTVQLPLPTPAAPLMQTEATAPSSRLKKAVPTTLRREQLLTRQDSDSNMTFATEAGWEGYGQSTTQLGISSAKPPVGIPHAIGMSALAEEDEEEESEPVHNDSMLAVGQTWKTEFPPTMHEIVTKHNKTDQWSHSFHGTGMSSLPTISTAQSDSTWDNGFSESPTTPTPSKSTAQRRSLDKDPMQVSEENFLSQDDSEASPPADIKKLLLQGFGQESRSRHSRTKDDALEAFHDSFHSLNSFQEEKQPAGAGAAAATKWSGFPNEKKEEPASNEPSTSWDAFDNPDKPKPNSNHRQSSTKEKSSRAPKSSKKKDKKSRKKKTSSAGSFYSDEEEVVKPKSSWWNLEMEDKSPSSCSRSRSASSKARPSHSPGWKKRENWKQEGRTKSAPVTAPSTNMLEGSFNGDFLASAKPTRASGSNIDKKSRRGRRSVDGSLQSRQSFKGTSVGLDGTEAQGAGTVESSNRSQRTSATQSFEQSMASHLDFPVANLSSPKNADPFAGPISNELPIRQSISTDSGLLDRSSHSAARHRKRHQQHQQQQEQQSSFHVEPEGFGVFDPIVAPKNINHNNINAGPDPSSMRQGPARSRSADNVLFDDLFDAAVEGRGCTGGAPSEVGTGAVSFLRPSKREIRRSRSEERSREGVQEEERRRMRRSGKASSSADNGGGSMVTGTPDSFHQTGVNGADEAQDDGLGFMMELPPAPASDDLSPLTVATKMYQPTSRRRDFK